jgi:anaerobic magnesium-protoporphyrin IX monomethyl ester cyclase
MPIDLLLVNAPIDLGKKQFDLAFPFQRSLNFGLLSLAGVARHHGFSVRLFDPQLDKTRDSQDWIRDIIRDCKPHVIGISCISGFSYPSALQFAAIGREAAPDSTIIVGGKDHVGQLGATVLADCPAIDVVVKGEAESTLPSLLSAIRNGRSLSDIPNLVIRDETGALIATNLSAVAAQGECAQLDYSLLPEFQNYAPSIEVSRGCGFGCEFCVTARTKVRRVAPATIIDRVDQLVRKYDNEDLKLYFETPMFLMRDSEIETLAELRRQRGMQFTWRTETRVDYLSGDRLELLAQAGLRVLDVGFESGDPDLLLKMHKTKSPAAYLAKAREVLAAAYNLGITLKLNVLFYIGETPRSIARTLDFLQSCMPYVECVSAYPLLSYPGAKLETSLVPMLGTVGGGVVTAPEWKARHLAPINLSAELSYHEASRLGLDFAKAFQSQDTFYYQKTYGYFSPGVTKETFVAAVNDYGLDKLPFASDAEHSRQLRTRLRTTLDGRPQASDDRGA